MKFKVSGEIRHYPKRLYNKLEGLKPPEGFECNGCSCSPDYWRGKPIWVGCVLHDYAYVLGNTWADRYDADKNFYYNLKKILIEKGISNIEATSAAWLYWGRVRLWGAQHFNFSDKEEPLSFWQRFREVYGIFKDKRNHSQI